MSDFVRGEENNKILCLMCGSESSVKKCFDKNRYEIYRCNKCLLMFVAPSPDKELLKSIYSQEYFCRGNKYQKVDGNGTSDINYESEICKLNLVKKYVSHGTLLDVGCATGGFLDIARDNNFVVSGVELSKAASSYARDVLGLNVIEGDLPSARLPDAQFDVVTLWDVIEHLDDPRPTLSEIYRILKPGGFFILSTGDSGSIFATLSGKYWHLMTPPQHLFFYNKNNLIKILNENGFSFPICSHNGKSASLEFIFFKICEIFCFKFSNFKKVIDIFSLGRRRLYINLFDIVTCVSRKL